MRLQDFERFKFFRATDTFELFHSFLSLARSRAIRFNLFSRSASSLSVGMSVWTLKFLRSCSAVAPQLLHNETGDNEDSDDDPAEGDHDRCFLCFK